MVISKNEHEFKGNTLQEYLEWKYPTKEDKGEVEKIDGYEIKCNRKKVGIKKKLEGNELDLKEFKNIKSCRLQRYYFKTPLTKLDVSGCAVLESLDCSGNDLIYLNVEGLTNLETLDCSSNKLTSVDFLNRLPNPEKLEKLEIYNNNIKPTTLDFLRPFVNLRVCKLGENADNDEQLLKERLESKTYNKFYGSLEPIKELIGLSKLDISGTDVDSGLEYLPSWITQSFSKTAKEEMDGIMWSLYNLIDCRPLQENAKVKKIQDELKSFYYDIHAWQVAHLNHMLISRPEYFTTDTTNHREYNELEENLKEISEVKERLLKGEKVIKCDREINIKECEEMEEEIELEKDKIRQSRDKWIKLLADKQNKLQTLEVPSPIISQQTQTEISTQDESTQTNLTGKQIEEMEAVIEQLWQIQLPKKD